MFSPPRLMGHLCRVAALCAAFGMQAAQAYTVTNDLKPSGTVVDSTVSDSGLVNFFGGDFTVTYDFSLLTFDFVKSAFADLGALAGADGGGSFLLSLAYDPTVSGLADLPFTLSFGIKAGAPAGDTTVSIDGFAYPDFGDAVALHYDLTIHVPDSNAEMPIAGTQWLVLAGLGLLPAVRRKRATPALAN